MSALSLPYRPPGLFVSSELAKPSRIEGAVKLFIAGGYAEKEAFIVERVKQGWSISLNAVSWQTCVFGVGYIVEMIPPAVTNGS